MLTKPDPQKGETAHSWPYFLPVGKAVLFSVKTSRPWEDAQIAVLNLDTGEKRVLLEGGSNARYVATGHLVYARRSTLFAVPFDLKRLEIEGTPLPVVEGVSWYGGSGFADFCFSNSGDLVYVPTLANQKSAMEWVDRKGDSQDLGAPPRAYANPSIPRMGNTLLLV